MRTYALSLCLMIGCVTAYGQNYTLPSDVFDRMYFEVVKGRACDSLQSKQAGELEIQGLELVATGQALKLSRAASWTFESEVKELRQALTKTEQKAVIEAKQERRKGRKESLTVGVIVGIALCLLVI